MPRSARLDAPGVLHHVMIRGIERRKIFRDDGDREDLLERLSIIVPETNTSCYAWALMPNHAHFLFRSGESGIAKVMRRLLTGYAVRFNLRHNRHGQLFQNRYKSVICQEDAYLKELVRYIHLNPLRGKVVGDLKGLNHYRYAGHSVLMGNNKNDWQETEYVLSFFGKSRKKAREMYFSFVEEGVDQGRRPELVGGGLVRSLGGWAEVRKNPLKKGDRIKSDQRILGGSEFVMQVLSEANERVDRKYELKSKGIDIEKIEEVVLETFGIRRRELYSLSRKKVISEARSVFCFWCVRELGETMTSMAKRLGLTQPAIGYAVDRGEKLVHNRRLELIH